MIVLKIIGLVLLAAVGLLVLSVCLLLFVPVRYRALVTACGTELGGVEADIRASWLLKILRLRYSLKAGESGLGMHALFFRINLGGGENEPKGEGAETGETDSAAHDPEKAAGGEDVGGDRPPPGNGPAAGQEAAEGERKRKGKKSENEKDAGGDGKGGSLLDKIRKVWGSIKDGADKAMYYANHPDRNEIISETWALAKRLCKAIVPRRLRLTGEIGLDEPHKTAYLFAAAGALRLPVSGVAPNFDRQAMNVALEARGRLSLWDVLWPLFRYAIKKPIWPFTKKIIYRKGDKNEQS